MDKVKTTAVRAGGQALVTFLSALLTTGLTNLSADALELAALTGAAAGLAVVQVALQAWLDQTALPARVKARVTRS